MDILKYLGKRSRFFLVTASIFSVLLIGLLDRLTGLELSFSIFYLIPVSLAAWFVSRASGVVLSFASSVAWFLADLKWVSTYSGTLVPYWEAGVRLGFFIIVAFLLSALKESLKREEEQAKQIQQSLLPRQIPQISGFQISGAYKPASNIGGDYYDVLKFGQEKSGFCVADVAGKGIPAALLMSNLQAAVRAFASDSVPPHQVCQRVNRLICDSIAEGIFITFFYGVLDGSNRKLFYTNAGHDQPIYLPRKGEPLRLHQGGMVLGVLPYGDYAQGEVNLASGDKIIVFTDGVTEARNPSRQEFGEGRLLALLEKRRELKAADLQNEVMEAVSAFVRGDFQDDATLLVISVD